MAADRYFMPGEKLGSELGRRLAWLLVFRGAIATGLFLLTLAADIAEWQMQLTRVVLYGVVVGSYLVVIALGVLLRSHISPVIISAVHLTTTVMAAVMVVQGTGGVESGFSFLYLLVILDGAIIGGRPIALAISTAASLTFGAQLVFQLYGIFPAGLAVVPPPGRFISAAVSHMAAFYLVALLAGHLAQLWESARAAVSIAQIDLDRVEAFQAAVLASLPVGVLTIGEDRHVQTANAAAERIIGQGLVGMPVPDYLEPCLVSGDRRRDVEVHQESRVTYLSVSRAPVQYPSGDPSTVPPLTILVIEDRTEVQSLLESLIAQERLASLGQLSAAIAHELRNPLAAISGSLELLMGECGPSERRRKLEAIVMREIERLDALVGDFLLYARPSPLEPTPTDLVALIRDLCEVLKSDVSWGDNPVCLEAPDVLEARVDAGQVRQMLWNLLRNALEASERGAVVDVALERIGSCARIVIRDHGAGLDPEIREHLFEPFRTTKTRGTGLGLAMVERSVRAHGGDVALRPADGGGTEARVLLPLEAGATFE